MSTQPLGSKLGNVPVFWAEDRQEEHLRKITIAVNRMIAGAHDFAFSLTLDPDKTETTFEDPRISKQTVPTLTPCSASAAAASGKVYVTTTVGKLTVNHDSQPATDRVFAIALHGT